MTMQVADLADETAVIDRSGPRTRRHFLVMSFYCTAAGLSIAWLGFLGWVALYVIGLL
jgi:hypothetical protein